MASFVSSIKRRLASFLPLPAAFDNGATGEADAGPGAFEFDGEDDRPRKRRRLRDAVASGTATPRLLSESTPPSPVSLLDLSKDLFASGGDDDEARGGVSGEDRSGHPSDLLRLLPNDVLSHCLSYVKTPSDRYGLQVSCKLLHELSDKDGMLASLELGGDPAAVSNVYSPFDVLENARRQGRVLGDGEADAEEGEALLAAAGIEVMQMPVEDDDVDDDGATIRNSRGELAVLCQPVQAPVNGGIILDCDTSITACEKLVKFAAAGNMQAVYMIAMILCYCHENISEGIALLRHAADSGGHLPSTYALALILRDSRHSESDRYMNAAAARGYTPAWQEKLTAAEMRAKFGDLDAKKLVGYLDPPCLNKLLGRHYLGCRRVSKNQTSHCWNPLCGRWAYKALRVESARRLRALARFRAALLNGQAWGLGHRPGARNGSILEPVNLDDVDGGAVDSQPQVFSIEEILPQSGADGTTITTATRRVDRLSSAEPSPLDKLRGALRIERHRSCGERGGGQVRPKVSRMKMCSSCRRAKYCSKLCQVYDWRSGRHKMECQFL